MKSHNGAQHVAANSYWQVRMPDHTRATSKTSNP